MSKIERLMFWNFTMWTDLSLIPPISTGFWFVANMMILSLDWSKYVDVCQIKSLGHLFLASCLNLLPLPSMYCPDPSPSSSASVGAYFNIPFAWLLKQKIPIKEQTPQAGFVFQWVFSVSKAMQLWTVAVWLVQCQAVSFRKIRDDQFFEEKRCRKILAETRTQELLKCSRISFRKVLISRKFKVCLWHGFLCHF